ncbi:hypothetical protein [Pseudoflavitalea rhizosphaerae]|uniref:hypothetical protein n=1 Tax=Pseudoflavitalea rhizosphaerae TaxID=1884793 RepID=UPI000F8E0EA9|nr:hypothetical protein [Pseudoflavitalea rhizosphaerae]
MTKLYPSRRLLLLWKHRLLFIPFFIAILFSGQTYGQAYVNYSRVFTSPSTDAVQGLVTDEAGNSYMVANFNSVPTSFTPTIPGTPPATPLKPMLIKFSASGGIVWSRFLTTSTGQYIGADKIAYDNGKLYLINGTSTPGLPTTDGSTYNGGTADALYVVLNASSGAIETLTYLGGSGEDQKGYGIVAENGFAYVVYATNSPDVPVTTGPAFNVQYDHVVTKLTSNGSVVYSTYTGNATGGGAQSGVVSLAVHNGTVAFGCLVTADNNFAITTGDPYNAANGADWGIVKLNADGSTAYRRVIGGSGAEENSFNVLVNNGEVFIAGTTPSANYSTTDGTSTTGSVRYHVVTKFNNAGATVFSTVVAGVGASATISPIKFNSGSVFVHGSNVGGLPVMNVTDASSTGGNYIARLNPASGQPLYAIRYGVGARSLASVGQALDVIDGRAVCMTSTLNITTSITTDGTIRTNNFGNYLAVFSPEGKLTYGTYRLTGQGTGGQQTFLAASNNRIYTAGVHNASVLNHYPLTEPMLGSPNGAEVQMVSFV